MLTRDSVTRQDARVRLRELIAASRPGERLPSERQLSARWGAARMTIRRATETLMAEGLVERRHGSGTFVAPQPFARLLGLTSFTQDMRERGLRPSSRLLAFQAIDAEPGVSAQLRRPASELTFRFTRLRLADEQPMAVETVWIPASLVPGLGPADLSGSLYALLEARYGLVTGSASVTIEPTLADAPTRHLLEIDREQACLRLLMLDRDVRGRVIMVADCVYRGDRYQLSAELSGVAFRPRGEVQGR